MSEACEDLNSCLGNIIVYLYCFNLKKAEISLLSFGMSFLPQYQKAPPSHGGDEWLFGAFGTGFRTLPFRKPRGHLAGESSHMNNEKTIIGMTSKGTPVFQVKGGCDKNNYCNQADIEVTSAINLAGFVLINPHRMTSRINSGKQYIYRRMLKEGAVQVGRTGHAHAGPGMGSWKNELREKMV